MFLCPLEVKLLIGKSVSVKAMWSEGKGLDDFAPCQVVNLRDKLAWQSNELKPGLYRIKQEFSLFF